MRGIRLVLMVCLCAACQSSSNDDRPDVGRCEQVVDRIVELRLDNAGGIQKDLAAHREAMRGALRQDVVTTCTQSYTTEQVACALNASKLDQLTACMPMTTR